MASTFASTHCCLRSTGHDSALRLGHRTPLAGQVCFKIALKTFSKLRRKPSDQVICATQNVEELNERQPFERIMDDPGKNDAKPSEKKSDDYSTNMTNAMGAALTYRHELGMNYNFILPDLIVGSCLQTPSDVDHLRRIGVRTIFCLQQDPDLEYFGVDIGAIQEHAREFGDIEHIRAQIRDFDPYDLRMRLPAVIAELYKAVKKNKGITYIHCTAGLGRAPAVALTFMYWLLGYGLLEANSILQGVRPCFPKLESIRTATCDLLTGDTKETVYLKWRTPGCENVEISGLDVGWGQRFPLTFIPDKNYWMVERELPVGKYEYKYVVDGNWTNNPDEPVTEPNKDGHVNNYVEVVGESVDVEIKKLRQRLMQENSLLSDGERQIMVRKLLSFG